MPVEFPLARYNGSTALPFSAAGLSLTQTRAHSIALLQIVSLDQTYACCVIAAPQDRCVSAGNQRRQDS